MPAVYGGGAAHFEVTGCLDVAHELRRRCDLQQRDVQFCLRWAYRAACGAAKIIALSQRADLPPGVLPRFALLSFAD
jgi:hypothetical protein